MADVQRISFRDSGQDFTEFLVRDGVVIDCQPFQGAIWVGTKLLESAKVGQFLKVTTRLTGGEMYLQHNVESVETLAETEADEAVRVAHEWARRLQFEPGSIGL